MNAEQVTNYDFHLPLLAEGFPPLTSYRYICLQFSLAGHQLTKGGAREDVVSMQHHMVVAE